MIIDKNIKLKNSYNSKDSETKICHTLEDLCNRIMEVIVHSMASSSTSFLVQI